MAEVWDRYAAADTAAWETEFPSHGRYQTEFGNEEQLRSA